LRVLGPTPANNALAPSVRTIRTRVDRVEVEVDDEAMLDPAFETDKIDDADDAVETGPTETCLRVLRTSKG
jgi:hypothetical protein